MNYGALKLEFITNWLTWAKIFLIKFRKTCPFQNFIIFNVERAMIICLVNFKKLLRFFFKNLYSFFRLKSNNFMNFEKSQPKNLKCMK